MNKYYNYEPKFNGVFSRDNLRRIIDGALFINLNEKQSKWTHWVSLFNDRNTYFLTKSKTNQ